MKKTRFGAVLLAAAWCVGMAACAIDDSSLDEDTDGESREDEENLGEVEQAIGEGGNCLTAACDAGLTCCRGGSQFPVFKCRNLTNDENNCGTCGHQCTGSPPSPFTHFECQASFCTPVL